MGFWDNLGEQIASKGQAISNKTKEMAGTTKLNYQIDQEKKTLQAAYMALGEAYYRDNCDAIPEEYAHLAADCKASLDKIAEMEAQKQALNNQKKCCACGAPMSNEDIFCPNCGTKNEPVAAPEKEAAPAKKFCPNCGNEVSEGMLFCANCGSKL